MGKNNGRSGNFHSSNNRNNEWGKDKIKTVTDNNGAKRHCPDSSVSSETSCDVTTDMATDNDTSLQNLSSILQDIEKSGEAGKVRKAVDIIFQNESFKSCILSSVQTKMSQMEGEIRELKNRIDDMEQYSRRNCLKISGIEEHKDENTGQSCSQCHQQDYSERYPRKNEYVQH
jgi:hypothetical protein